MRVSFEKRGRLDETIDVKRRGKVILGREGLGGLKDLSGWVVHVVLVFRESVEVIHNRRVRLLIILL